MLSLSLASVVAAAFVLVPGLALYRLLGFERNRFAVSIALGIAVLVTSQVPVRLTGVSVSAWLVSVAVISLAVLATGFVRDVRADGPATWRPRIAACSPATLGAVAVAILFTGYHVVVGGYSEVPSDFWNHLERIRWEIGVQTGDHLIRYHASLSGLVNRDYAHALHALVASQLGVPRLDLVESAGLVAVLLFLLSTYWLAYAACEDDDYPASRRTLVALIAVGLVVAWKGTTVFGFVRYYAMAPAMLAFVVYNAFILTWLEIIRGRRPWFAHGFVAVFFAVAMLLMHQQELAFALVMAALMLAVFTLRRPEARTGGAGHIRIAVLVIGVVITAVVTNWLIATRDPGSIIGSKLLYIGDYVPYFEDVFILNPANQFYSVMGWFGLVGLVIALWRFADISRSTVLVAGLLTPLVTVFNPGFVYLYLHVAKFETVWRWLFMLPLSLILAKILVDFLGRYRRLSAPGQWAGTVTVAVMAILLTPMDIAGYRNPNSRFDTLTDTRTQGVDWIRDVVEFLQDRPAVVIYTDPITSYVLRSATNHHVFGWKFYPGRSGYNFVELQENGELGRFLRVNRGLYVINRRDTQNTRNGAQSGHWYEDVLTTSQWYPPHFVRRLETTGAKRIYDHDGIVIYASPEAPKGRSSSSSNNDAVSSTQFSIRNRSS